MKFEEACVLTKALTEEKNNDILNRTDIKHADNNCTDENIKLKIGNNVVGEAIIRDYHDGEKFLCNYEIFPKYRGKGYGLKCLDYMVKNKGINSLSVGINNSKAIYIYKKYGFNIVGEPYDDGNGEELSYYMKLKKK